MSSKYNGGLYDYNITTIKQYGDNTVKISNVSICRKKGFELEKNLVPKNSVNEEKLGCNLARAKARVQELVLCNDWDYWCTFTISPEKYDRYNLKAYFKDFAEFLHNYNRRCEESEKVKYILIPEMHKDNAWHMHGFIKGIRKRDLYINKQGYISWKQYDSKFGFISMDKIKSKERSSSYVLKYMTKDVTRNVSELGAHLYYCSKGLKEPIELFKGKAILLCDWDWEHPDGYCRIKRIDMTNKSYSDLPIEVLDESY